MHVRHVRRDRNELASSSAEADDAARRGEFELPARFFNCAAPATMRSGSPVDAR